MNETVMIVGGTSGMGQAAARLVQTKEYRVVLTGRSQARVDQALNTFGSDLEKTGDTRGLVLDFTSQTSVDEAFGRVESLDHLVLVGSGAPARGTLSELNADRMQRAFEEKFLGFFRCLKAALPRLNPRGSVTVVTGGASRAALPGTSAVSAVNAALQAWGLTLAKELAPLRVNVLSPGFVDTPLHDWMAPEVKQQALARFATGIPVGRVGRPEEIAAAILFLIENPFTSGAVLDVDGGGRLR